MRQRRLAHVEHAVQIDVDHRMPIIQRHVNDRLAANGDAGVIDQYIQAAHLFDNAIDQSSRLIRRPNIGLENRGITIVFTGQFTGEFTCGLLLSIIVHGDHRALCGECYACSLAQATSGAGD